VTVTVTFAVCVTEPIVPVAGISEVPGATPVTTPAFVTVATAVVADTNVSVAPDIEAPFWSFAVAVRGVVLPTVTLGVGGASVRLVNTGVGAVPPPSPPPLQPVNATRAATANTRAFCIKPP
jgi:hypothetical protein